MAAIVRRETERLLVTSYLPLICWCAWIVMILATSAGMSSGREKTRAGPTFGTRQAGSAACAADYKME
jgi:hypothetical protein